MSPFTQEHEVRSHQRSPPRRSATDPKCGQHAFHSARSNQRPARNVEDRPPPHDDRSGGLRAVRGCRPVEKPGSTTLPARRLSAIVRSLTADKATLPSRKSPKSKSSTFARSSGTPMLPGVARKVWPPRCAKLFIVPPVPSRATLAKRFCASAACTWNAALSTSSTKADCAEPPSREQKISLNATRSRRLALI